MVRFKRDELFPKSEAFQAISSASDFLWLLSFDRSKESNEKNLDVKYSKSIEKNLIIELLF